jgi:hypothetical protein
LSNETWDSVEHHIGRERLQHYLAAASGDTSVARALYDWNVEASAAFWGSLGHLEVALRNTVDARMTARHERLGREGHWIFDDQYEFGRREPPAAHQYPYVDVVRAKRRVMKNGKPVTPGQLISEVSFGFWHQMVSRAQMRFWPDVATGFPGAPDRAQTTVRAPVSRLRDLRNRIGHHHRIWNQDLRGRYDDVLLVTGYIDPVLSAWVDARSAVPAVLRRRPQLS